MVSEERQQALLRLKASLTESQIADLQMVIQTAEVQGDYDWNGEGSVWIDDVNLTLMLLADEFSPPRIGRSKWEVMWNVEYLYTPFFQGWVGWAMDRDSKVYIHPDGKYRHGEECFFASEEDARAAILKGLQ